MSEHQELLAAIAVLIEAQNRTTAAIEAMGNLSQATVKQTEPAAYEDIPAALAAEIEEVVTPTAKPEKKEVSEADLKTALLAYSKQTDTDTAKGLLASFGAKKLSDVAPEKRGDVIAAIEGLLE